MCQRIKITGLLACPVKWPGQEIHWCPECRQAALLATAAAAQAELLEEIDFAGWLACWAHLFLPFGAYPGPGKWSAISPYPGRIEPPANEPLTGDALVHALKAHLAWTFDQLMAASPN